MKLSREFMDYTALNYYSLTPRQFEIWSNKVAKLEAVAEAARIIDKYWTIRHPEFQALRKTLKELDTE